MKTQNNTLIWDYLKEQSKIADMFPVAGVSVLINAVQYTYQTGGRVFTFGNGGGSSIADHFATDLAIHPFVSDDKHIVINKLRLEVHCLNNSNSLLTCLANDIGYDWIFVEQLKTYKLSQNDLIIAFSTSGNSLNVHHALKYARLQLVTTALISGRDGGKAKEFADICVLIPGNSEFPGQVGANDNCFHIEDFQQSIAHIITGILKERINA